MYIVRSFIKQNKVKKLSFQLVFIKACTKVRLKDEKDAIPVCKHDGSSLQNQIFKVSKAIAIKLPIQPLWSVVLSYQLALCKNGLYLAYSVIIHVIPLSFVSNCESNSHKLTFFLSLTLTLLNVSSPTAKVELTALASVSTVT